MHHVWWLIGGFVVGVVFMHFVWPRLAFQAELFWESIKAKEKK